MTRFQTQLGLTVLYLYTRIEFIKIFCKYYIHTEQEINTDYSVYQHEFTYLTMFYLETEGLMFTCVANISAAGGNVSCGLQTRD